MDSTNKAIYDSYYWIIAAILLSIGFAFLYASFPPDLRFQHHDSLNYAFSAEIKGYRAVWPNHPLGHVIHITALKIARSLDYSGKAFPIFQYVNAVFGGWSVAIFFILLLKILMVRRSIALALAVLLGGSFAFWNYAGTGDIYTITVCFILLSWLVFLYQLSIKNSSNLLWTGLVLGVAILSHQLAAMFGIAAFAILLRERKRRSFWISMVSMGLGVILAILFGYYLLGAKATGSLSLTTIVQWMQGYMGDSRWGGYWGLKSVGYGLLNFIKVIVYNSWNFNPHIITNPDDLTFSDGLPRISAWVGAVGILLWLLLMATIPLAVKRLKNLASQNRSIFLGTLAQTFIGGLVTIWWLPTHLRFWLLNAIPLMFVLAIAAAAVFEKYSDRPYLKGSIQRAVPLILSLVIVTFNVTTALLERNKKDPRLMQELQLWIDHSNRDDLLITHSDEIIQPLRYWGNRIKARTLTSLIQFASHEFNTLDALHKMMTEFLEKDKSVFYDTFAIDQLPEPFLAQHRLTRQGLKSCFEAFKQSKIFELSNPQSERYSQIFRLQK